MTTDVAARHGEFYRINSAKGTLRDYMLETKNPLLLTIALALKGLRIRIPSSTDDPAVDSLEPFVVAELPEEMSGRVRPVLMELKGLGFDIADVSYHVIDDVLHATRTYLAAVRSGDGRAIGRVHIREWAIRQPPKIKQYLELITPMETGGYVWSMSGKGDLLAPKDCVMVRKKGATARELWGLHEAELSRAGGTARVINDGGEMRAAEESLHQAVTRFHLDRGVFEGMTEDDRKRVEAKQNARATAAAVGGPGDAEVLAEIDRLQEKRSAWWKTAMILGVSLLLFVGLGKSRGIAGSPDGGSGSMASTWDLMAILVGVLFVHELGHYIAMRGFGYRNLRMFFIPFFGAAVSGRHYNVAGWKKAIVSLMGPVPGIVLGVVLGLTGIVLKKTLLTKIGLMALILNGFNLLPVLPLDGGWVAHTLVFSRHYLLDAAFRVVAAGVLALGGVFMKQRLLMYLGAASLVGLPVAFRQARIVAELRRSGLKGTSPDDQSIPPEAAHVIIEKLRAAFPRRTTTKILAQRTVQVFETLNARPPGWLGTLGLGAVHLASFVTAIVFAAVLVIGGRTDLGQFARAAAAAPKNVVSAASMRHWPEEAGAAESNPAKRRTIIATFAKPALASEMFERLRDSLPEGARIELFGQSVMVSLAAKDDSGRRAMLGALKGKAKDVFVATGAAGIQMSCIAPNEKTAEEIETRVKSYFAAPGVYLTPPWIWPDSRTPEERAGQQLARKTYERLLTAGNGMFKDERFTALSKQITRAIRDGDEAQTQKLQAERKKLVDDHRDKALQAIRDEGAASVDVSLADRYIELIREDKSTTQPIREDNDSYKNYYQRIIRELGPRMGQVALGNDGKPLRGAERQSARFGMLSRSSLLLTLNWAELEDPFEGAPAIVRWLDSLHCIDIKYAFDGAPPDGDEGGM